MATMTESQRLSELSMKIFKQRASAFTSTFQEKERVKLATLSDGRPQTKKDTPDGARMRQLTIKERDYALGNEGEKEALPLFQKKFDRYLCKTGRFNTMDFMSPKTYVELKSRNCRFNDYADIMIGKNKVDFCLASSRRCILAWRFTDGIYCYDFNKEDIESGDVYFAMGGRCDRGKDERKEVAYIKRHLLTPIS